MGHGDLHLALAEKACFGTFLKLPRPEVVDLLALAGFDFVICDMEHAQVSEMEARTVSKRAQPSGCRSQSGFPSQHRAWLTVCLKLGPWAFRCRACEALPIQEAFTR